MLIFYDILVIVLISIIILFQIYEKLSDSIILFTKNQIL